MTQSVISNALLLWIHTIFSINLVQSDTAVIHCPDIAFLGTSARLTCSTSVNFTYTIYDCPCGFAAHCPVSFCFNVSGYNASIVNQTQTEITIISVQQQHAGNWSCSDGGNVGTTSCHLVVAKIPSVNITSDADADSVCLGDRISLTVDIRDYHCSEAYSLTLQVGSVTYTCNTGRNATIKYLPKIVPINVTQTHFGDVKVVFACGNHQWNITPEGVNELLPNRLSTTWSPPTPSDTSTLFIVAGGIPSIVIIIMIITFACSYKWKKQALRSGDVCSGTAGRVPQEQEEAVYSNTVYEASHVPEVRGPLGSTDQADSSTRLGGGDSLHPERRGEYVALDMNAAQPSNMYEHLRTYEQNAYM